MSFNFYSLVPNRISENAVYLHMHISFTFSKDVSLPTALQRAMAAEAEAAREARAKVIAAEGEMKSSRALKEASEIISASPSALQVSRGFITEHRETNKEVSKLTRELLNSGHMVSSRV